MCFSLLFLYSPFKLPYNPFAAQTIQGRPGTRIISIHSIQLSQKTCYGPGDESRPLSPCRGVFRPGKWDKQGPEPMQPGSPKTKLSVHLSFWHLHNLLKKKKKKLDTTSPLKHAFGKSWPLLARAWPKHKCLGTSDSTKALPSLKVVLPYRLLLHFTSAVHALKGCL